MASDPFTGADVPDGGETPEPIPFPSPHINPDVSPEDARIAHGARRLYARAQGGLRQSMAYASEQQPDAYAKNLQVADRLGVQPDLVDGSPELHQAVYQQQQDAQVDRISRDHPELAKWLTDPTNASLVHDDLGAMRTLDVALQAAGDLSVDPSGYLPPGFHFSDRGEIVEPLPGGLSTVIGGFDDLERVLAKRQELSGIRQSDYEHAVGGHPYAYAFTSGMMSSLQSTRAALGIQNTDLSRAAQYGEEASSATAPGFGSTLIRGAGGLVADIPLMLAGGGVLRGGKYATDAFKLGGQLGRIAEPVRMARRALLASGKMQGYLRGALEAATVSQPLAIREGLSTADEHGAANGAMSWLIETVVPGAFGKTGTEAALAMTAVERKAQTLAIGDSWLHVARMIAAEGGYEGAEEAVTELAHALHERASGIDPRALESDRLVSRLASAGILGAAAGGAFAAPHEAIAKLSQDLLAHDQAITFRNRIGAVATAVAANPLTERAPERMHGLIQGQTGDLKLFYQTDEWDTHWQAQGIDPIRAADLFGIRDEYLTARAHGGEVAVPLSHVVMPSADPALPKDVKGLLDIGRQAPGAPNAKQADTFDDEAKQQVADLVKANTPATATPTPDLAEVIGGQLAAKLEAAGRSPKDAAAYGQLFGTIFRTLGERLGIDPQALADRFPVTVEKGNDDVPRGTGELEQAAFHGSPHEFERFTTRKIGSGEGQQAFGWGLYFSGKKEVAEFYRNKLSPTTFTFDGKPITPESVHADTRSKKLPGELISVESAIRNAHSIDGAQEALDRFAEGDSETAKGWKQIADFLRSNRARFGVESKGKVYTVDIPEDATLLDWDRPMADQPASVQAAFANLLPDYAKMLAKIAEGMKAGEAARWFGFNVAYGHMDTAGTAYQALADRLGPKGASQALAKEGVPGIRYLDQGSRAGETSTSNYVLFRGPDAKITEYEHSGDDQRRASITFGPDRSAVVRLFQTANRSSMLHELGHLWLEVLGDLSQDASAPQRLKDDYASALTFLGVEKREDIQTKHHELFARGFEQYLATGKAPSQGLRRLFARFRAWMLSVYRDLRRLNVTLSPEITGVFDRLVATDEEIAAAEHQAAVQPIFSTAEQAGKTPEQFDAYRATVEDAHNAAVADLEADLVARYQQEEQAAYQEERATVRADVAQEIGAAPVFQALAALQDGLPDGTSPKLSKAGVLEYLSPENLALLPGPASGGQERPNRGRRVYTTDAEQGIHPDQAAGLFGFESGDALVRALIAAPDLDTLIDARTDDVMKELHPDPLTDGQLKEKAQAAIQSEEREKVVREELSALRALEKAARPVVKQAGSARQVGAQLIRDAALPLPVYREAAKRIVAGLTVSAIRPNQYLVAAGTNARKAFTLVNKAKQTVDDYAEAAQAKEQELLSMELYRAARAAVESTEKMRSFLEDFQEEKTRQKIGKAGGWEWTVVRADGSTERVGSEVEARKLALDEGGTFERSSGYLEQIDALLERFDLSKARRSAGALARRESLRDWLLRLEVNEDGNPSGVVADIPDSLRDEAFSTHWRSLTMAQLGALRDAVANIAHLANTKNRLLRIANQRTVEETIDDLVGSMEEHGPAAREVRANRTALDHVGNFFEGYLAAHRKMASLARVIDGGKDGGAAWEAFIRPLNDAANAELEESGKASAKLMALLKEWGKPDGPVKAVPELGGTQLSTIGRVMVALNWGNAGNRQRLLNEGWSADQVTTFLSTLDAKDLALVQGVWDLIGSYWSDIKAKMQRMTGTPAERVEAIPFDVTTADGKIVQMRGGYFPIAYDEARSPNHSSLTSAAQAELALRGAAMRATTARGHEQQRQKVVAGKRLLFSPAVITGHLNQVIHDLTHHEVIRDASRLLSDKRLAKEMHDRFGPQMAKQFRKGLEDVAAGEMGASDMVERSVRWIRSGVSIAAMGFNATSAAMQITGLAQSMVRVGPKYMGKAIARIFRDARSLENSATFVDAKSPFMKARGTTMVRELREAIHRSDVGVARRRLTQAAYFMMAKMQRVVDVPTWLASYEKAKDADKTDADAVAIADQTIIDTQGSGFVKDLSAVQRNKALAIFTPFMHYLNVQMNLTAESVSRLRKTGDVVRFGSDMLLLYAVPAVFAVLLKDLLRGAPEDDEDSFAKRAAKEGLTMLLGTTLVTREAGAIVSSDRDYAGPAGSRGIAALVSFGHQALQGDLDHGLERATVEVLGMALRLPTVEVQRVIDAAISDSQDNQVRAALFGKRPVK